MATIGGTIQLPNGQPYIGPIKFHRQDAPAAVGGILVTGVHDGLTVHTEENGEFATELKAGAYKMQISGSRAWLIHVLDDTGSYNMAELGVPGFPSYAGTGVSGITFQPVDKAVQGFHALRALAQHEDKQVRTLAYLYNKGDTQGGEFIYDAASMAENDGVDVARPNDVAESAPGRWHRQVDL